MAKTLIAISKIKEFLLTQILLYFFPSHSFSINNAVQLSCYVQKIWINISTICHGLLGGLGEEEFHYWWLLISENLNIQ